MGERPPENAAEAERLAAEDHAADIMFNSGSVFENGCVLCEAAIRLGVWEGYGYTEAEMRGDGDASDEEEHLAAKHDGGSDG